MKAKPRKRNVDSRKRISESEISKLPERYQAQIRAQLGQVEEQEERAATPKQKRAVEAKKRSIFRRVADMLSSRKRAAKKAGKLEAKAKLLRAKAARPTVRQRIKKRAAKEAHGLVSRILGNPKGRKRNVEQGFMDASGVFHPIRASKDYSERKSGEVAARRASGSKKRVKAATKGLKKTTRGKKRRNVEMGYFDGSGFHPIRASADYSEGRGQSRSKKTRARTARAASTAAHRKSTQQRKATTARLAGRALRSNGRQSAGNPKGLTDAQRLANLQGNLKMLEKQLKDLKGYNRVGQVDRIKGGIAYAKRRIAELSKSNPRRAKRRNAEDFSLTNAMRDAQEKANEYNRKAWVYRHGAHNSGFRFAPLPKNEKGVLIAIVKPKKRNSTIKVKRAVIVANRGKKRNAKGQPHKYTVSFQLQGVKRPTYKHIYATSAAAAKQIIIDTHIAPVKAGSMIVRSGWVALGKARTSRRFNPKPKRRNGESAADQRKMFAGKVGRVLNLRMPQGTPKAGLSTLGPLAVIYSEKAGQIEPTGGKCYYCRDLKGKLYFGTPDGQRPLWSGPAQNLGPVRRVEYLAAKPHLGEPKVVQWFHDFEAPYPILKADGDGGIRQVGGGYKIKREGIVG